ncbi:glycosyltransferase family 4 protein [Thalassotalea euphylliae]|uniref:Glycosyltransferase family 4 protein n=1 Tax=Thalassotalea euphylliae TaxID=1655234 RepID=A0A3E0TM00_9GAMM|nr:glycosyltransferase family 4 protein [Thalassotalea euphylliae]REL25202.1 glycosyltransferase family 4 protein [Thalassotalea euphylliae]
MASVEHVAIVGPLPPPAGGMANQTEQFASFLESEGVKVTVVQVNLPYEPRWVGKIPMFRALVRLVQYQRALKQKLADVDLVHIMANSGWSWHLFAAPAIKVAKQLNKPVVLNYRGGYAADFFAKSWSQVKKTLDLVDDIVVPSSFLQGVFSDYGKTAKIIPNVLNEQRFNCLERQSAMKPTVIVTRNLEAIYDVATAINVFAGIRQQFPNAELKVAGTGPELANLQALCQELALAPSVEFVGRLSPDEVANLYKAADLMLNTSVVDNSPNALIEALACGTPIVSSNVGGIPQLVSDQYNALLAAPKDIDKMTQLSLALLTKPEQRQTLIANGLTTIEKFYWRNVWRELEACYQQAIQGRSQQTEQQKKVGRANV